MTIRGFHRVLAGLLVAAVVGGCASGSPAGRAAAPVASAESAHLPVSKLVVPTAESGAGEAPEENWRTFARTGAALRSEITRRAEALREGPIGSQASQLASLRLASSGRDLIDAGSLDGALETLQKAISLWGRDGYAYAFLACVHHLQGRSDRAAEFAATAERYLPRDRAVRSEFEALTAAIRQSRTAAGS